MSGNISREFDLRRVGDQIETRPNVADEQRRRGQPERAERGREGLPLCGVRPMMSRGERAAAEAFTQAFTYTHTGEETDCLKHRNNNRNLQETRFTSKMLLTLWLVHKAEQSQSTIPLRVLTCPPRCSHILTRNERVA